jgi:hypothetical protein
MATAVSGGFLSQTPFNRWNHSARTASEGQSPLPVAPPNIKCGDPMATAVSGSAPRVAPSFHSAIRNPRSAFPFTFRTIWRIRGVLRRGSSTNRRAGLR